MDNATSPARVPAGRTGTSWYWLIKHGAAALLVAAIFGFGSGRAGWTRAWVYLGLTVAVQAASTLALARVSPDLLVERSRLRQGTKPWDKLLAPVVAGGSLLIFLVAALDVRFHWPPAVPAGWSAAALAVCGAGALLTHRAMVANRFFSATVRIQVERGHVVVDGGPYRRVRHPGYTGALAFTLASPLALGSWAALVPAAAIAAVLVVRTALEDRTLHRELTGYPDYARRVRYRLLPGLW